MFINKYVGLYISISDPFDIDEESGEITVRLGDRLDRETKDQYMCSLWW